MRTVQTLAHLVADNFPLQRVEYLPYGLLVVCALAVAEEQVVLVQQPASGQERPNVAPTQLRE